MKRDALEHVVTSEKINMKKMVVKEDFVSFTY